MLSKGSTVRVAQGGAEVKRKELTEDVRFGEGEGSWGRKMLLATLTSGVWRACLLYLLKVL